MNVTKSNVLFCRRKIAEYEAKAKEYEAKAMAAESKQLKGTYLHHAKQRHKDARRWLLNMSHQMNWLAVNNPTLWRELQDDR